MVRAIEIVERALEKYGPPVYVRHEIVHNKWVVDALKARGARFVEELVRGAAGRASPSSARMASRRRWSPKRRSAVCRCSTPPARWCPRCTRKGRHYLRQGRTVILIGHAGHPEVEGTLGQIPGKVLLVQTEEDVAKLDLAGRYARSPT